MASVFPVDSVGPQNKEIRSIIGILTHYYSLISLCSRIPVSILIKTVTVWGKPAIGLRQVQPGTCDLSNIKSPLTDYLAIAAPGYPRPMEACRGWR